MSNVHRHKLLTYTAKRPEETPTVLNIYIDELVVKVLKQMRLKHEKDKKNEERTRGRTLIAL